MKLKFGISTPGFDLSRIRQPAAEIFRRVVHDAGAELSAAREMREIGRSSAWAVVPLIAWQLTQLVCWKSARPFAAVSPLRGGGLKLRFSPGVELRLRFDDDQEMHPRVLGSAKFRADSEISPRLVRLQPDVIRMPGHGRDFSRQFRHPEFVQHIGRFEPHRKRLAHRNVEFIRHNDARFRIAHFPPPLMAGDHMSGSGAGGVGDAHGARRERKEHNDQAAESPSRRSPPSCCPP